MNGQSWLSIHLYVSIGFRRVSILLALLRLVDRNDANALREAVSTMFEHHTSLNSDQVLERLISFGADGMSTFQGCKNGVGVHLRDHIVASFS